MELNEAGRLKTGNSGEPVWEKLSPLPNFSTTFGMPLACCHAGCSPPGSCDIRGEILHVRSGRMLHSLTPGKNGRNAVKHR